MIVVVAVAHVLVAHLAWFMSVGASAARLGFEDRDAPPAARRGEAIFPIWPLAPLVLTAPMIPLGPDHPICRAIAALHVVLLLASISSIAYWRRRTRAWSHPRARQRRRRR